MAHYTKEDILRLAEEEGVEFIRLQFTDMFGTLKNVAVTARELERALNNACIVDGSHLAGIASETEPDMVLYPDYDTFAILPWRPQQGKVARLLCDIYRPDGTPCVTSARYILKETTRKAAEKGYVCFSDPECEFFLFHTNDNGMPTTLSHEKAGYLDISPMDLGENARRDMVLNLEDLGIEVESSHHENSPAQHEIDFKAAPVEETADRIISLKMTVRTIAKRHGLHATFMPKPRNEVNGSGMHIHFSLFRNGKNVFVDPEDPKKLSEEAYYFVGGLMAHSKEMALITNPLVNSYKRLVPGFEAPTELTWTTSNQNSLVRIPGARGERTTIELRSPDGASNPYLVLAVCLAAGLDGIERKIYPTKAANRSFSASDTRAMKIEYLPENLQEAIDLFEESEWMQEILGKEFCTAYTAAKRKEWRRYIRQVTEWEIEEYLYRV
ncbi:MAG: type I glutamate--ammonia ligase [Eubacteriales bacterium]|nr:type I glutamate--ammonia ligase [Eubacteriales bacterium]